MAVALLVGLFGSERTKFRFYRFVRNWWEIAFFNVATFFVLNYFAIQVGTYLIDEPYADYAGHVVAVVLTAIINLFQLPKVGTMFVRCQSPMTHMTFKVYREIANQKEWKYFLVDLIGAIKISGDVTATLWLTPRSYMRLHTAAAYLLDDNFASLYTAPAFVWDLFRKETEHERSYGEIVRRKKLAQGVRFVQIVDGSSAPHAVGRLRAVSDFRDNNDKSNSVSIYSLPAKPVDVPDFSAFGHGNGTIVIRIRSDYRDEVLNKLKSIEKASEARQHDVLEKLWFPVVVTWNDSQAGKPFPPLVQGYLDRLNELQPQLVA